MADNRQVDSVGGRPVLPVNLLVADWPCLVVGGGRVAQRKTVALLAAGARVHLVSPDLIPDLAALAAAGRVTHTPRRFDSADVRGMRLVFAATNDRAVNRQVLAAARAAGAVCGCVDDNWTAGDFVTPATMQRDGLTITVSTGGRSCRQARMVKETLGRHIQLIETADLLILGTSHEQLALEQRETVQLLGHQLAAAGDMLWHVWGVHEFMLLITCNRVELAAIASASAAACGLLERILGLDRLAAGASYRLVGMAAFEHLALVTAGMRSQSPGEYHVAAQVKEALNQALQRGWANGMLQAWVAEALHISKHIKNEVTPLLPPIEIEDSALAYVANQAGEDWRGRAALVIGAGALGRGLVDRIIERGGRCAWCYHVNRPVEDSAWGGRVRLLTMDELRPALAGCEFVFCAAEVAEPVLGAAHADAFPRDRPVWILDLGVPRNVSPDLASRLPRATVVNLDRLKDWSAGRRGGVERALAMSRDIVKQHKDTYGALLARYQGRNAE